MEVSADPTDLKIIETLRSNPRKTNKEIANELAVAETTVSQRIKSMAERNVMRVVAQKHVFSDSIEHLHMFFANTSGRTVQEVCAEIAMIKGVYSVAQGIGNPDIFVTARTSDLADAFQISKDIGSLEGVTTVEVCPCFRIHKMDSRFANLSSPSTLPVGSNPKDDAVIHAFMREGRQSNREVARQLNLSEGAIRQRLNKLMNAGQIQFEVITDPAALSLGTVALIRLTTLTHHTSEIVKRLIAQQDIHFVGELTGTHNLLALTTTKDTLTLGNLCDNELLSMTGVTRLDVQLLVATTKHEYHLAYF